MMKYRNKIIDKFENIIKKYNLKRVREDTKNQEMKNILPKIFRLCRVFDKYNLKNYNNINEKIHLLKYGLKECPVCEGKVLNFATECCSYSCARILYSSTESEVMKKERYKKATANRDYYEIQRKRIKTMMNDIDKNGKNAHQRAVEKAKNTMVNDIDIDGKNTFQRRNIKACDTIRKIKGMKK